MPVPARLGMMVWPAHEPLSSPQAAVDANMAAASKQAPRARAEKEDCPFKRIERLVGWWSSLDIVSHLSQARDNAEYRLDQ